MCKETNKIRQAEYKWKKDLNKIKKDSTKDLYPSIKMMIKNASAVEHNKAGELSKTFLSLYNSRMHNSLNIQLHQLFEDAGMGDVVFAEGVSTNMWDGIFTQVHKSAPGPFSPFSFSQASAISSNSKKDKSLLPEIYSSTKGVSSRA